MHCASCGSENPEGAKFCIECAAPLGKCCPNCRRENLPRAKFCSECATLLTAEVPSPKSQVQSPEESGVEKSLESRVQDLGSGQDTAERRQLTVMFCDLVGSTPLAEQLDPEELREVIRAYQEACAEVISRFEGYIARYVGDALLVYFGYPVAHEDDAQRAVRAGLGIVGAMYKMLLPNLRLQQLLQVRIGIHSGLVVVGEMGSRDYREAMALGETPNVAARLQGLAEPNAVVVSAATQRLIEGFFEHQDLGPQTLKGVSAPVRVFRIMGESQARSRLEVAATTGLTPLVGREEEVGLLLQRWERVKEGQGQVVLLSGEAGIGKSRLLQVLQERIASDASARVECRCSPYYQNTALYPVIDLLQRVLGFQREDNPEEKLHKLEEMLERRGESETRSYLSLQEAVPLFASLLSLPLPTDLYPPLTLTPQKQKEKTQQALLAWLLQEAERQPVRFDVEDLHWADPSTLEFLGLLIDQAPTTRLLIVLTFRPEFLPLWPPHSHVTPITLSRLGRTQTEVMIERVTGGKMLPAEMLQQIVSKTDGVPLFIEELTKMVLESGLEGEAPSRSALPLGIPATLQDALMARLDRLTTAKEVAQLGATLGREFSYELLQAIALVDEARLQQALAKLVEAEVLYRRGLPPQARYLFKHALIQDTAYQSLLKSKRQQYHRQIAQVLEGRFSEIRDTQPELLAHHYTEAGLVAEAIPYWQQAGQRAAQHSANLEAISHLTKGLELLKTLPDTPERAQQELTLQLAQGAPLMATKGYAAPEMEKAYTRALELCRQLGETPQLFPILFGLTAFRVVRAEFQTARELGEQLLRLAQSVQDPALLVPASHALGQTLYFLGELVPAQEYLERGIAVYDPQKHRALAAFYGTDPGAHCLCFAAYVLWHLGYPDQALKRIHEALHLAQEFSHPFNLAFILSSVGATYRYLREVPIAQEWAETTIALCTEQGFALLLAIATILRGWALTEQGQIEEGITQLRQGVSAHQASGAVMGRAYYLALLAEAYGKAGQAEEGLTLLAEALDLVNKTGGRMSEAELLRLKGELTLQSSAQNPESKVKEVEECFQKAVEVARQQQAKSLELRAAMSLSRLWQSQGKREEARQMLVEIYNWFSEGFDTADLQEAKALLEELTR
ncbi:MAG: AAA family ATPase [Deltaproteobacteria bacterium]|nr:AAA family ATPase [Deltaproteobacteria bacterium]